MFFPPPEDIETQVHARLPEGLRRPGPYTGPMTDPEHSREPFLEGPAFDRLGNLHLVDIRNSRILCLSALGNWSVTAEYDGIPNGLKVHKDGRLFVADRRKGILTIDPKDGKIEVILSHIRKEQFRGVNDLTFSSRGELYFTDQGESGLQDPAGKVYRLRTDGQVDCLLSNIPSPNGLVLTPDERFLLLAVTRANQIWRLPLHPDGSTSRVSAFVAMTGGLAGPDGMAIADDGSFAVAHAGLGVVWLFNRLGEPTHRIRSCEDIWTTNIAFGGPDGRTLFITESGSGTVLKAQVPVTGLPMFSHHN